MKNLKNEIREWIFENLLLLLFKFSNTHKLIRLQKLPQRFSNRHFGTIDYQITIRVDSKIPNTLLDELLKVHSETKENK